MSAAPVISIRGVSKSYRVWDGPGQRLLSPAWAAASRLLPGGAGRALRRRAEAGYRDFHALRQVSLEVKRGESVAIIGRNGSGKSTLLQIVAGTLRPTAGAVSVTGRTAALLELGSGFNPDFTGRENVFLYGTVLGLTRAQLEERFDRIAAFADIGEFLEQPVKTYSSGMALRLAFAVVAHIDASVLIIDEALAVGDVYFMQKCNRFLRAFRESGTLLFVSHDMGAVRSLCDRAVWLEQGAARATGPAAEIAAAYLAEANLRQDNQAVADAPTRPAALPPAGPPGTPPHRLPAAPVDNPLTVSPFNRQSAGFGDGRVRIIDAAFVDATGRRVDTLRGGEVVCLAITARAAEPVGNVIFGFNLKDRLGQHLLGENTFRGAGLEALAMQPGDCLQARFTFQMPVLHRGDYAVIAAVAAGTPGSHRQQDWLHEALVLSSGTDWAHAGLVGLPMLGVSVVQVARSD